MGNGWLYKLPDRSNREILPADAGETLLSYARHMLAINDQMSEALSGALVSTTIRLGVPEDFVTSKTTRALAAFNHTYPQLEIMSGLSRDLISGYDHGKPDLVPVKQHRNSREAVACCAEKMEWASAFLHYVL